MKKFIILAIAFILSFLTVAVLANTYPIIISSVVTKDMSGNPTTEFSRGDVVVIETTLEANPSYYFVNPINYLEIIETLYSARVMGLLMTRDTISSGETKTFGGGMLIRDNDPTGTYTVKVLVWNGFPSEMGTKWKDLADPKTTTFEVKP